MLATSAAEAELHWAKLGWDGMKRKAAAQIVISKWLLIVANERCDYNDDDDSAD